MMKNIYLILLIVISAYEVGTTQSLKHEIGRIIQYDTDIEFEENEGLQIAVIDDKSSITYQFGGLEESDSLLFELGSVSKVLTSSLVIKLVKEGYFKLSDPINNYLPSSYTNPRLENILISDLLNHTSGFSKRPSRFGEKEHDSQDPYAHYTKLDLLKYYRDYLPDNLKHGDYNYAHTNYGLLEVVIENATQEMYERLITEVLFKPLGMFETFVSLSEHVQDNLAVGYDRSGERVFPRTYKSFSASEGVKSTIGDLIKFTNANINSKVFNLAHKVQVKSSFNDKIYGGMGWHILQGQSPYDILTVSGKTSGYNCTIVMIKETKTGVIILNNSSEGAGSLAYLILRMINDNWNREPTDKL